VDKNIRIVFVDLILSFGGENPINLSVQGSHPKNGLGYPTIQDLAYW
jgi:hypothetical protein